MHGSSESKNSKPSVHWKISKSLSLLWKKRASAIRLYGHGATDKIKMCLFNRNMRLIHIVKRIK